MDDKLIEAYMAAFLYELEHKLNFDNKVFRGIKFQQDEANTDKELKTALKAFIEEKCNTITMIDVVKLDNDEFHLNLQDFGVVQALIPDDYDDEISNLVKEEKKDAVLVKPDLVLKCRFADEYLYQKIELKSTKTDKIPGSSVQQVLPNEWVIFVKHNEKDPVTTITGKYKDSISGTMQFPDRSPRPQVSFDVLQKWVKEFRDISDRTLVIKRDDSENERTELLTDWQGVLSKRWLGVIQNEKKKKNEPWFNNNLRKFILEFIEFYDGLNAEAKKNLKEKIKRNINENGEE